MAIGKYSGGMDFPELIQLREGAERISAADFGRLIAGETEK